MALMRCKYYGTRNPRSRRMAGGHWSPQGHFDQPGEMTTRLLLAFGPGTPDSKVRVPPTQSRTLVLSSTISTAIKKLDSRSHREGRTMSESVTVLMVIVSDIENASNYDLQITKTTIRQLTYPTHDIVVHLNKLGGFYALPSPPQTQASPSPEMQFGVYTIR
ncbi:hypothetical protein BGW80DRAFT_1254277 [Lactifluus volemus]|nr:hypothetical protein BGW80DRAFT_1254277 [Lactifluus volemus]